jgi:Cof subfamily protein (haloacid dehalogenase superfamily)
MTKALFFDIDGTLVSFQTHQIPQSTLSALQQVHDRGHKIFIATGRPRFIINNLTALQSLGLIDGYVTMNGSYCYIGDEVVYEKAIPRADADAIVHFCRDYKYSCVVVGRDHIVACHPDDVLRHVFYETLNVPPFHELSFDDYGQIAPILQFTPFITAEEETHLAPFMTHCESGRWHPAFTDITAKGNTKQRGIDEIIRHCGMPLSQTVAFGDGGNDVSMLRHAAIGVAMGQASDEVKDAADYVTASVDEGGIQKALQHLGLID